MLPIDGVSPGDDPRNPRPGGPIPRTPLGASYWIPRVQFTPEVTVNPGGGSGWDEPPLDIQIPDDARELDREVLAYRRELRAKRRRDRLRRLAGPFAGRGTVMPLLASILAVCLVAGAMLSVATFSPTTAPADQTPRPTTRAASTALSASTTARPSTASTTARPSTASTTARPSTASPSGTTASRTTASGVSASGTSRARHSASPSASSTRPSPAGRSAG
jgi:hypothetical protein